MRTKLNREGNKSFIWTFIRILTLILVDITDPKRLLTNAPNFIVADLDCSIIKFGLSSPHHTIPRVVYFFKISHPSSNKNQIFTKVNTSKSVY